MYLLLYYRSKKLYFSKYLDIVYKVLEILEQKRKTYI